MINTTGKNRGERKKREKSCLYYLLVCSHTGSKLAGALSKLIIRNTKHANNTASFKPSVFNIFFSVNFRREKEQKSKTTSVCD